MNEYLLEEVAAVVVVIDDEDAKASQRFGTETHVDGLPMSLGTSLPPRMEDENVLPYRARGTVRLRRRRRLATYSVR